MTLSTEPDQSGLSDRPAPSDLTRETAVPATTSRRKVGNIQSLRAVAALLVVFVHLTVVEAKYGSGHSVLPSWFRYGAGGVDLFFVISGFVMVTVTQGKFHSGAYAGKFLFQRATRIYPLCWFYSLLVLAVFLVKPSLVNPIQGNQVDLISSFLLLPTLDLRLLGVTWTLVFEFYFYLVFSTFLLLKDERHLPIALLLWTIAVGAGQTIAYVLPVTYGPSLQVMTHPMTYQFIVGCLIGALIYAGKTRFGTAALACGIAAFAVLCLSGYSSGLYIDAPMQPEFEEGWQKLAKDSLRTVLFGIPASLIVYGAVSLEVSRGVVFSRWMERIGDASFSIYLSHELVLAVLGRIWRASGWNGPMQSRLVLILMVATVIGFGFFSYHRIELPLIDRARNWRLPKVLRARE